MKQRILAVAVALVLCLSGSVWAAEESTVERQEAKSQTESWTADEWLEAQVVVLPEAIFAGQQCGGAVCGKFEYCCNPTCSLCLPYGMSCTQIAC
jgi:hypothetical protein